MNVESLAEIHRQYKLTGVLTDVSPEDRMWISGPDWYFSVGESAVDVVLAALAHSSLERVGTILDLPCGHGRVARHLRAAFPEARMNFCDLLRPGVDYCAQTFGGEGIYSHTDLLQTPLGSYDLIWVGSLFTHLRFSLAAAWLERLCNCLTPDGLVVATFHGRWSLEVQKSHPLLSRARFGKALVGRKLYGWGYASYAGAERGAFGISLSTPSKVLSLASTIPGVRILSFTERGWADNHDVLVLGRPGRLEPWN
jgi:SAM-dependent methyltransferase